MFCIKSVKMYASFIVEMATRSGIDQLQDAIDSITPPKKRPTRSGIDQLQDVTDSITPPKKRPALYSNSTKNVKKH